MSKGFETSIIEIANDFYDAFLRCLEGKNEKVDGRNTTCASIVSVPAIVNGSFALELYLKSMLSTMPRRKKKTHKIAVLFSLLDPETQAAIKKDVELKLRPSFAFDACLRGIDDSFEHWRYIHEAKDFGFGLNSTLAVLPLFLEAVRALL